MKKLIKLLLLIFIVIKKHIICFLLSTVDPIQASARNKEFNRLTKNQREEYCNQGIRLNDGIGRDAYFCVV